MPTTFRVGVTRDFLKPDGHVAFGDVGFHLLDQAEGIEWEFLSENAKKLSADQVSGYDGLIVLAPHVTSETVAGSERLCIVARFGVGYDSVDVDACSRNGVLLSITPDGVRRPVATAAICFVLALSHKLLLKDRLTRDGRWGDRMDYMGMGLTGRTLGVVGLGNIGREVVTLAKPFAMRHLASDPHVTPAEAEAVGAELVSLETLMQTADFVILCCALTPETHHLIDARRLALMKPSAYLINVARGPVVDQQALLTVLQQERIQGAALDVFEQEPIDPQHPLLRLKNVIVTPHAISWTDECFQGIGHSACQSILEVAAGRMPSSIVNRDIIANPLFQKKLNRFKSS